MSDRWIVIPRWDGPEGFQHYKNRDPKWIKVYTRLLDDPNYLRLTLQQRGVLHGLWLWYAMSGGCIPLDLKLINRYLAGNSKMETLEALNHAGFIEFSASKPLAHRYQPASPEQEVDREREGLGVKATSPQDHHEQDLPFDLELAKVKLRSQLNNPGNGTIAALESYGLPPAAWHAAAEELQRMNGIREPIAYTVGLFKAWKNEGRYA